ncbi:hypothetical protein GCM10023224_04870 [Streptomonospora halophila]|uniref:Uncharacterized protein n=1 Tax=Streptomonospora halophila TaxID=427369 RepID=A0ABP9GDT4_9ACTN
MDTATPASENTPVELDANALAQLRAEFGQEWDICRDTGTGRIVATHRTEPYDAKREAWILRTTVTTATPEAMHTRLTIQEAVRSGDMYERIPDGHGSVVPPGGLVQDFGDVWRIECRVLSGAEYYTLARHVPPPAGSEAYGVEQHRRGPSTADRIRRWLVDQAEAMKAFEDSRR